jgi:hypothetical protein
MKIVRIFEGNLYAVRFDGEELNVYDRLIEMWNDTLYLKKFYDENKRDFKKPKTFYKFRGEIYWAALQLDKTLVEMSKSDDLSNFFEKLHKNENEKYKLSQRKGKFRFLRLYAIKKDNMFIITSGAIKLTRAIQDRKHTQAAYNDLKCVYKELKKYK